MCALTRAASDDDFAAAASGGGGANAVTGDDAADMVGEAGAAFGDEVEGSTAGEPLDGFASPASAATWRRRNRFIW